MKQGLDCCPRDESKFLPRRATRHFALPLRADRSIENSICSRPSRPLFPPTGGTNHTWSLGTFCTGLASQVAHDDEPRSCCASTDCTSVRSLAMPWVLIDAALFSSRTWTTSLRTERTMSTTIDTDVKCHKADCVNAFATSSGVPHGRTHAGAPVVACTQPGGAMSPAAVAVAAAVASNVLGTGPVGPHCPNLWGSPCTGPVGCVATGACSSDSACHGACGCQGCCGGCPGPMGPAGDGLSASACHVPVSTGCVGPDTTGCVPACGACWVA